MMLVEQKGARLTAPYPIGLLVAILWYYAGYATDNIRDKTRGNGIRLVGFVYLIASGLLSLLALVLFVRPVVRELLDGKVPK